MYELAKSSREKMKAKARRLAGEKDQKVDSSDWSPAPMLRADVKTGARPIMKPSAKGIGESNAAADTKAAIGDIKRGAYKSGGAVKDAGVYDKKALGAIDPRAKRAATPTPYKKGGKVVRASGGLAKQLAGEAAEKKFGEDVAAIKKMIKETGGPLDLSGSKPPDKMPIRKHGGKVKRADGGKLPNPYEAMRSEERMGRMKVEEKRKLPPPKEAAESAARTGDMPAGRKHGGKKIAKKKGGSVGLTVVIADKGGRQQQAAPMVPPMPRGVPVPMPAPAQGAMGAPGPGPMMPPGAVGAAPPAQMPMMRKAGGRVTKVAKSYQDMEAGAVSGEGRLQKTDIAKLHKGAPARKDGGRISKVAKSYKDMTAGAGDGEGRLQKTDIAKAKKVRAA